MAEYSARARERAMKAQEVILRMYSKRLTFWQAANILRISPRHLRRILRRYQDWGFGGLYDRRLGKASPRPYRWRRSNGFWGCTGRNIGISACVISTKSCASSTNARTATVGSRCCCREPGWWRRGGGAACIGDGESDGRWAGMMPHIDACTHT
jgi:Helix-turn-helix domain